MVGVLAQTCNIEEVSMSVFEMFKETSRKLAKLMNTRYKLV